MALKQRARVCVYRLDHTVRAVRDDSFSLLLWTSQMLREVWRLKQKAEVKQTEEMKRRSRAAGEAELTITSLCFRLNPDKQFIAQYFESTV